MDRRDVYKVMKWKSPELRQAQERGFVEGFVAALISIAVIVAALWALAEIV